MHWHITILYTILYYNITVKKECVYFIPWNYKIRYLIGPWIAGLYFTRPFFTRPKNFENWKILPGPKDQKFGNWKKFPGPQDQNLKVYFSLNLVKLTNYCTYILETKMRVTREQNKYNFTATNTHTSQFHVSIS